MTEPAGAAAELVRLITGYEGKLTTPEGERVPVRVVERPGNTLMLVVLLAADEGRAPEPMEPVLLEYTSAHGLVRLRGDAVLEQRDLLRFTASQTPEIVQRREFVRVEGAQRVEVEPHRDAGAVKSHAIDVSGGGMLLSGAEGLALNAQIRFRLELDDELPIEGMARVVRADGTEHRAVVFEEIDEADRQRLIRFVFDRQRAALARTRGAVPRRRRTK
jgi:hypothetical protein